MPTRAFTIAKLADTAGVGIEAIRHYQRMGLLAEPARVTGGFRTYSAEHVRRLNFIRRARDLGFSLEDVAQLLSLSAERDQARVRELTRGRVAALRGRIARLESMAKAMEGLADCCARAPSEASCPIIAALVDCADEQAGTISPRAALRSPAVTPGRPAAGPAREARRRRNAMAQVP